MDYVDDMVIDGLFNSIECSLRFLLDNTGNVLKTSQPKGLHLISSGVSSVFLTVLCTPDENGILSHQ